MTPAPRCLQACPAPTEHSLARQVINSYPSLDWFPAGSERADHRHPLATTPAVRSLTLPDRQTSPRTVGSRPGAARDREIVTAQGAATGSAVSGTDKCPDIAWLQTQKEVPPPELTLGAGDLIDGGRRLDLDRRIDQHLTVLDVRTSSLQTLCDRLPLPASTPTADLDNDAVKSPPPLDLPRGL